MLSVTEPWKFGEKLSWCVGSCLLGTLKHEYGALEKNESRIRIYYWEIYHLIFEFGNWYLMKLSKKRVAIEICSEKLSAFSASHLQIIYCINSQDPE